MAIGNSTPANYKKDDDNDSTCTSIQNFMTDMLPAEDIPDNEARIIREVIEEEADILEDTLDSHWLQDDASVDTDFRLDFSFSPFSTPRSRHAEPYYTPFKQIEDNAQIPENKQMETVQKVLDLNVTSTPSPTLNDSNKEKKCTIDMNLENALQNQSADKVYLDQLLATPPVIPDVSAPSTPLITNILFGEKLEDNTKRNHEDIDEIEEFLLLNKTEIKGSERYENLDEISVDEKFKIGADEKMRIKRDDNLVTNEDEKKKVIEGEKLKIDTGKEKKFKSEEVAVDQANEVKEIEYCVTNFYCKMCERQFKNLHALRVHCARHHKITIKYEKNIEKTKRIRKQKICDQCGKIFASSRCLVKHIENHKKPETDNVCKYCTLKFSCERSLNSHISTHTGQIIRSTSNKKYVCNECGKVSSSSSNYNTHMRRHRNEYTIACEECGKGFYKKSELVVHMRKHTGEKPYQCMYCPRSFARTDVLNRHLKCHTDEKPYPCNFCGGKFRKPYELKVHQNTSKTCLNQQLDLVIQEKEKEIGDVLVWEGPVSGPIKMVALKTVETIS